MRDKRKTQHDLSLVASQNVAFTLEIQSNMKNEYGRLSIEVSEFIRVRCACAWLTIAQYQPIYNKARISFRSKGNRLHPDNILSFTNL